MAIESNLLADTAARIGHPRRNVKLGSATGWLLPSSPSWMTGHEPLAAVEGRRADLYRDGTLVRGQIVQANDLLFEPGEHDCPAEVLYDAGNVADPEALEEQARVIFGYKSAKLVDPELADLGRRLAAERDRHFGYVVPRALSSGHDLRLSAVMVHRQCLPRPYLLAMMLPLLVDPATGHAVVLPSRLWADDLREAWIDLGAE
jgi:hypothetical protein